MKPALLLAAVLLAVAVHAGEGDPPAPAAPSVDALDWLTGTWRQNSGDSVWEEHWLPPRAGTMAAVTRWVQGDSLRLLEMSAIETRGEKLTLSLRHFGPGLALDGKDAAVWTLAKSAEREAVFEDPDRPFPRRIGYRRVDDEHLEVRLEGKVGEKEQVEAFTFTRVGD